VPQTRRLSAPVVIYVGSSRSQATEFGGVTLQIARGWVVKFNAKWPAGLIDENWAGMNLLLGPAQRETLADCAENIPVPAAHGFARWRIVDLCQWANDKFGVSISEPTISRVLRSINYCKLSAIDCGRERQRFALAIRPMAMAVPGIWCGTFVRRRPRKTPVRSRTERLWPSDARPAKNPRLQFMYSRGESESAAAVEPSSSRDMGSSAAEVAMS
jgi:transposase